MKRVIVWTLILFFAASAHAERGKNRGSGRAKLSGKSQVIKKTTEQKASVATPEKSHATKAMAPAEPSSALEVGKTDRSSKIRKVVVAKFSETKDAQARNAVLEVFSEQNDIEVIGINDAEVVAKRLGADLSSAKGRAAVSQDLGVFAWVDGKVSGHYEAQIDLTDAANRRLSHAQLSGASAQILASVIRTELWGKVGPAISDRAKLAQDLETQRKLAREKLQTWQKELERQRQVASERESRRERLLIAAKMQAGEKLRAWNNEIVRQQQVARDRRLAQAQEQQRKQEEAQRRLIEAQRQQALEQQRQAAAEQAARQAAAEQAARQAALQRQLATQPQQVYQQPGVYQVQQPVYPQGVAPAQTYPVAVQPVQQPTWQVQPRPVYQQPVAPAQTYPVATQPVQQPAWQVQPQPAYQQPVAPAQRYPVATQPVQQPAWQIQPQPAYQLPAASGQAVQYSLPQQPDTTGQAPAKKSRAKKSKKR